MVVHQGWANLITLQLLSIARWIAQKHSLLLYKLQLPQRAISTASIQPFSTYKLDKQSFKNSPSGFKSITYESLEEKNLDDQKASTLYIHPPSFIQQIKLGGFVWNSISIQAHNNKYKDFKQPSVQICRQQPSI